MRLDPTVSLASVIASLETQIPDLMQQAAVVGLSIALMHDAHIVWQQGFGFKNKEANQPVTADTVFEAASLSKPLFAALALQLCASGSLNLDTPLTQYLAEPYLPNDSRHQLITARHVLSHTTGFPNWRKDQPLQTHFTPGERFSYSGEGYVYLQRVIEQLTGQSLAELSRLMVLEPLRMTNSSYIWLDQYASQAAQTYNEQGEVAEKFKPAQANAAYSLHTTCTDFAQFMLVFMEAASENSDFFPAGLAADMVQPQVQVNDLAAWHPTWPNPQMPLTEGVYWGLGWGIERQPERHAFWHWGDNGSSQALALGLPQQGLGLLVMSIGGRPLEIWPTIVQSTIGGTHPALDWLIKVYTPG